MYFHIRYRATTVAKWCRSIGSKQWMDRHVKDHYVRKSVAEHTRSRSAYKLEELDNKYKLFARANTVVDLGASPGGWSLYVATHTKAQNIVAVDLLPMEPIPRTQFILGDFTTQEIKEQLYPLTTSRRVSVVLSDMAPNLSGNRHADHSCSIDLAVLAYEFSTEVLSPGGSFLCKYFQGSDENSLILPARKSFGQVKRVKPAASRKESSEMYLLCLEYKGAAAAEAANTTITAAAPQAVQ